jgi:hypothetical protein
MARLHHSSTAVGNRGAAVCLQTLAIPREPPASRGVIRNRIGFRSASLHLKSRFTFMLCVVLLDTSPATAAYGSANALRWNESVSTAVSARRLLWVHSQRTLLSQEDDSEPGMNTAGAELEKIIASRDVAMKARETYVENKMHQMVTKPWATVHPLKLERDERLDEALVKQAERQVKADQRLLSEAKSVSEHDKKLLKVAVARKSLSLQIDSDSEDAQRRQQAVARLSAKQHHAHSATLHPVCTPALCPNPPFPLPNPILNWVVSHLELGCLCVRC